MSVRKEFTTKSGLTLPLTNLKGKEYLLASNRIQWFVHENVRFTIDTDFIGLTEEKATCKVIVNVFDEQGNLQRRASGIKSEDKKHFEDFAEKAATGALSRALSYLGYGTQFSGDELNELINEKGEEVNRLADAPTNPKTPKGPTGEVKMTDLGTPVKDSVSKGNTGFKKKSEVAPTNDDWQ